MPSQREIIKELEVVFNQHGFNLEDEVECRARKLLDTITPILGQDIVRRKRQELMVQMRYQVIDNLQTAKDILMEIEQ